MDLTALLSGDSGLARASIKEFIQLVSRRVNYASGNTLKSNSNFQYSQKFSTIEKWPELWRATFTYLDQDDMSMRLDCLSTVRFLSRDKTHMDEVITETNIRTLLRLANIDPILPVTPADDPVLVESLKCLCNLVFNSLTCQDLFDSLNAVDGIMKRVRTYQ